MVEAAPNAFDKGRDEECDGDGDRRNPVVGWLENDREAEGSPSG